MAEKASFSGVHGNLPRQVKNPLLCVGHQRGNRQEVAATGSPGMEKTAPLETLWDHSSEYTTSRSAVFIAAA